MPRRDTRSLKSYVSSKGSDQGKPTLTAHHWRQLILETYALGCNDCQFIGGEPFLWRGENNETVLDLAEHAKHIGYRYIEIFTNATMIRPNIIYRIKSLGVSFAVSLYSSNEKIHDSITRTPGSFKRTFAALKMLKEAHIPTRVETVLMKANQATTESIGRLIKDMGFGHRPPDPLRPKGRGRESDLLPDTEYYLQNGVRLRPSFTAGKEFIRRSMEGNNCLAGKITITEEGSVLPCIFARNQKVGNVNVKPLEDILKADIQDVWKTTKDDVLVCQDCEYRYVCVDCRPLAQGSMEAVGESIGAPNPRCTYNPYTGEWAAGTWSLDQNGEPVYDGGIKPITDKLLSNNSNGQS
jgi:radical SAM protein with 4Fe4S-binding SPASM domain